MKRGKYKLAIRRRWTKLTMYLIFFFICFISLLFYLGMGVITRKIEKLQRFLLGTFYNYGYFLACHPIWFLVVPMIVCAALSVGILTLNPEVDSGQYPCLTSNVLISDFDGVNF